MGSSRVAGITRRHVVMAGLAAVAAAFLPARPGVARAVQRLTVRRTGTYARLVATLRAAPDGRFTGLGTVVATREFARWYEAQDAPIRAHVDAVLDDLRAALPLPYDALAAAARPEAGPAVAPLAAAVALAAATCAPPPAEDERPIPPSLWTAP
jgi:hypothetical protein